MHCTLRGTRNPSHEERRKPCVSTPGSTSSTAALICTPGASTSACSTRPGEVRVHQNLRAKPEALLGVVAPSRDNLVVAAEWMFAWYWVADLCAREEIPFVLGDALYMKAIHGGKAKNDRIDSLKIATLLRGGTLPRPTSTLPRCAPPAISCAGAPTSCVSTPT